MWQGFPAPGMGCDSFEDTEEAWGKFREIILPEFIRQLPGNRPWACFAVGEIELPKMIRKPYPNDSGWMGRDGSIFEYQNYFVNQEAEFQFLDSLDLIDNEEAASAKKRFAQSNDWAGYEFITAATAAT